MTPRVHSLDHLVLTVSDIDETLAFYSQVLGMTAKRFVAADTTERWSLIFGQQKINLHVAGREWDPKAAVPKPGTADLCFLSETPVVDWCDWLKGQDIQIEEGPVARTGATGPILSIYLRDPDRNLIEISNAI